jgi:hypothetical protein
MSVKSQILDGSGSGYSAQVGANHALLVQLLPETSRGVPPSDLSSLRLLREFFVDSSGSSLQRVNGSVTPVEFSIRASSTTTKWITGFRQIIQSADTQIATQDFRRYSITAAPGLTNGIQIEALQGGITVPIASAPIQKLGDYLNYANSFVSLAAAITAAIDYIQFDFDLPKPIVLTAGSTDRLTIRIRDDLTAALSAPPDGTQYAIATGYQETT